MPRKKINNSQSPIEEPLQEVPSTIPERIMPMMNLKQDHPRRFHLSGFLLLLIFAALAASAVYYWPGYGIQSLTPQIQKYPPISHTEIVVIPDKTDHVWKTYSTDSFAVMYPPTDEVTGDFSTAKFITIHGSGASASEGGAVTIEFIAKSMAQVRGEIGASEDGNITSAKDIKFNGYDAREVLLKGTDPKRIILISRLGGTFKITHYVGQSDDILTTFKFN